MINKANNPNDLPRIEHDIRSFTWHLNVGTAEMSDFANKKIMTKMFRDACDEGFSVVNHKSGIKRDFFLTRVNEQEGDLVNLEFQTSDGKLTIIIFND
jgi:translation initiation factor IF-1